MTSNIQPHSSISYIIHREGSSSNEFLNKSFNDLADKAIRHIFDYLSDKDLARCSLICRDWLYLMNSDLSLRLRRHGVMEYAFGKAKWEKYFGDVGIELPLPEDIAEILNSPCIFWPDKTIRETQLLVLIPKTVNGRPFTIGTLGEMIKGPQSGGHPAKYHNYDSQAVKELRDRGIPASYWALITKDLLPGSQKKPYFKQQALIKRPYTVPGALEIATGILMHHVETGKKFYADHPDTHTRCQEKLSDGYGVVVGAFGSSGLCVNYDITPYLFDYRYGFVGVGSVRKF